MGRGLRYRRLARASKEMPYDYLKGWNRRPDTEEYEPHGYRHGRYSKNANVRLRYPFVCYCPDCTAVKQVAVDKRYNKHKGGRYE